MSRTPLSIDPERIMAHARHLALDIGPRLAGSPEEHQAADYIQAEMRDLGLRNIRRQPFTCKWYDVKHASLKALIGDNWETITMDAVAHTPCTPGEIEAELVYVETARDGLLDRLDLEGKIALVHGTYGTNTRMVRRLAEKGVAAVIWTDVRYTSRWNVLVGLPFTFLPLFTFPAASVPHPEEWRLVSRGVKRVRLSLETVVEDRPSFNISGELPAAQDGGGVIICAHHDSVRNCSGAEDNAAGVGCALAIAEALRGVELVRPIRFASFGTEEQLSQGAFAFVDEPSNRAAALDMVLNIDGMGCWTGENETYVTGSPGVHEYLRRSMETHRFPAVIRDEPDGFSDHFPFIVKGVPAAWFHRRNCAGGRWFHHSLHETIDVLSPQVLADCASLVADIALDLATREELPFDREFPLETRRAVQAVAHGWLGGTTG